MRGDIVFRVYGRHEGREKDSYFGAFRSRCEAENEIARLYKSQVGGIHWASAYHNLGFVIREAIVEVDFEIPSLPKPRDKYVVKAHPDPDNTGKRGRTVFEVFRRTDSPNRLDKVCEFSRNYELLQTFEPFRQGDREFALISQDYTRTAVLDLTTGDVIAEEAASEHFCPVGFYVPDWWDVNRRSAIPGSENWNADHEWPIGDFGFVWGCIWGDDSSWKVQHLDLSRIVQGEIHRDDRYGYVELATVGFDSPCLHEDIAPTSISAPPPFIQVSKYNGVTGVTFAVAMKFDLVSGHAEESRRLRVRNLE